MSRKHFSIAVLALASVASAEPLPVITKFDNDTLIKTDVFWATDYALPVYVQRRFAPDRPLNVTSLVQGTGSDGMPPILDINPRRAASSIRFPRSEFDTAEAKKQLAPYLNLLADWADRANYVLVALQPRFGEYDFATRTFPFRLTESLPLQTKRQQFEPVFCRGRMWPAISRGTTTYAAHLPCLRILGIEQSPVAFTSLQVDDLALAKLMKESQDGELYRYLVLTRPVSTSLQTIPRVGPLLEDVAQVVTMEPVGLYVIERDSRKLVLTAPLTPAPRQAAQPEAAQRRGRETAAAPSTRAPALKSVLERTPTRKPVQIN